MARTAVMNMWNANRGGASRGKEGHFPPKAGRTSYPKEIKIMTL